MRVITISREYGAGGHTIGTLVAETLGIPFYDRDIIKKTAEKSGYTPDVVEAEGEDLTRGNSILHSISSNVFYSDPQDAIHDVQEAVILGYAQEGPCVILGRAGNEILRRAGINSLDVFIHADAIARAKRVSELIGSQDANEIRRVITKRDASRHAYHARYTGKRWADSRRYNLSLDSGLMGYDLCRELICAAARAL